MSNEYAAECEYSRSVADGIEVYIGGMLLDGVPHRWGYKNGKTHRTFVYRVLAKDEATETYETLRVAVCDREDYARIKNAIMSAVINFENEPTFRIGSLRLPE